MPEDEQDFRALLRSAGVLGLGRQAGALVFMGVVVALPRFAPRALVDDFVWAYFASLFLTSILNLGLERVVGPLVARAKGQPLGGVVRPVLLARFGSTPLTVLALWGLFRVVGVSLPATAWAFTLLWVVAIQFQGVAFAGLRTALRPGLEARLALCSRLAEAAALLGLAAAGAGVTVLVGAVAVCETCVALVALRAIGKAPSVATRRSLAAALPWRSVALYTGIEVLAFAYLRVDMVLVGHVLGAGPGATYGLIYRVIDALAGLATPVLLLLFPYAARLAWQERDLSAVRARALRLLPAGGLVVSVLTLFGAAVLAAAVPRLSEGLAALRLLVVAVPLSFVSSVELHLRSAEDRNREVLVIGAGVLMVNVVLNVVLVPRFGLVGAAVALLATETLQLAALLASGTAELVRPAATMLGYAAWSGGIAALLNLGHPIEAAVLGIALVTTVVRATLWPEGRALVGSV